jgi:hypothetical protein
LNEEEEEVINSECEMDMRMKTEEYMQSEEGEESPKLL